MLPPKKVKAPEMDIDDLPVKEKPEPGPSRRGKKDAPAERHNGAEESLFIDQ